MIVLSLTLKFNVNKFKIFDKFLFSIYFRMLAFAVCSMPERRKTTFYYFCVLTSFFEINKVKLGYACINN